MIEKVKVKVQGPVARITIARPEAANALDEEVIAQLHQAMQEAAHRSHIVVLGGEGKSFCAGADLAYMERAKGWTEQENLDDARKLARVFGAIRSFPGLVIAVVQGAAYGGGVGLVAAADLVLASRKAVFALSEVRLGLIPAVISPYLIARMGEGRVRAPALLGYRFDAEEARARGLVDRLVEPEELDKALEETLAEARLAAPGAVREAKALFAKVASFDLDKTFDETARTIARIRAAPEAQKGLKAFLSKGKPSWYE